MASLKTHSLRRSRHSGENETSLSTRAGSLIDALEGKASDADVQALLDAHPEAAKQVDCDGWLPIHLAAALQASGFVVQALLDVFLRAFLKSSSVFCLLCFEFDNTTLYFYFNV